MSRQGLLGLMAAWAALLLAACSTAGSIVTPEHAVSLTAVYGATLDGVSMQQQADAVQLRFEQLNAAGQFLKLGLPAGLTAASEQWQDAQGVLHLLVATPEGAELGLVPLSTYTGQPVSVSFQLKRLDRAASAPPSGTENAVSDLQITDGGLGNVSLSWTQVNAGDYDFNGEVNVADLTPLGQHFGETYDPQAVGARELTQYWIDGDGNGEIGISDLTPIGQHYFAYIHGYIVRQNGVVLNDELGGLPTVKRSPPVSATGLPPQYQLLLAGALSDSWVVAPVDAQGNVGADSTGEPGALDLQVNLNISGIDLLSLDGSGSGSFGAGKWSTRVVDPSIIVDRPTLGTANPTGPGSATVFGVRANPYYFPGKTLLLNLRYAPIVNLGTGQPKGGAALRQASQLSEEDLVTCSVPFSLPAGVDPVDIDSNIVISINPEGGYFVTMTNTVLTPGDDPLTPAIETSFTRSWTSRLDYLTGRVSDDTDMDGDFSDEGELEDDDRDCVSYALLEQEFDDDEYEDDEREEIAIEGIVAAYNETAGTISLTGAVGEGITVPSSITVLFSQRTRFEEKIKTDGDDIEGELDPSTIIAGDQVEIELYALTDGVGGPAEVYWAEKIRRVIDLTD